MSRGSVTPYLPCSDPIFAYDTDSVQCPLFGQICISPKTDESVNIALFTSAFPTMVQFIISEHPCTREYPSTAIICRVSPIPLILALSYTRASSITSDCPYTNARPYTIARSIILASSSTLAFPNTHASSATQHSPSWERQDSFSIHPPSSPGFTGTPKNPPTRLSATIRCRVCPKTVLVSDIRIEYLYFFVFIFFIIVP